MLQGFSSKADPNFQYWYPLQILAALDSASCAQVYGHVNTMPITRISFVAHGLSI
jgi:hypothetical protein